MVSRIFYKSVSVMCESDDLRKDFILDYYLLEKDVKIEGFSVNTYGIEISKREKKSEKQNFCEYRRVYDIFCTKDKALETLESLVRNTVTPVSLLDVLEDLIGVGELVNEERLVRVV
ncbi:MAG: hypothetical protein J6L59_04420 [Clostridia bacterium]|nr:hypothetical protein [Clostridia bacterium]